MDMIVLSMVYFLKVRDHGAAIDSKKYPMNRPMN